MSKIIVDTTPVLERLEQSAPVPTYNLRADWLLILDSLPKPCIPPAATRCMRNDQAVPYFDLVCQSLLEYFDKQGIPRADYYSGLAETDCLIEPTE